MKIKEYVIFIEGRETNIDFALSEKETLESILELEKKGEKVISVLSHNMEVLPELRKILEKVD